MNVSASHNLIMERNNTMQEKSKNVTINIGEINTLEVMRDTDYGYFLEAKDEWFFS